MIKRKAQAVHIVTGIRAKFFKGFSEHEKEPYTPKSNRTYTR